MAAIKQSEARLLVIFGFLILAAATFFVLDILGEKKDEMIARQTAVKSKIVEYNNLIKQKDQWEVKREFVGQYQPSYRSEEEEAPALEAYVRNHALAAGVEIKTVPRAPEPLSDTMISLSLEAKVTGTGMDILNFLTRLQGETKFYAIPSITIAADRKDPSIVKADLIFSRWFIDEGDQPTMDLEEPVEEPVEETPNNVATKVEATPAEAEPN
jgi:hypothetical protein